VLYYQLIGVDKMAVYIKKKKVESSPESNGITESVKVIIDDVEKNGDVALRRLSDKFDNWKPNQFKLSEKEIQSICDSITNQVKKDIKFAQNNIKQFANEQKESIKDIEVENSPGVILGHKNIPVNSVGCYVPGGRYPMIASAHMSILTAKVAGVKRVIACTPPINGEIPTTTVYAMKQAGADE